MDILNFISWIASKRRVVTSAPDDALVPIGIRTETRDDKYTTVAIKKSDLISSGFKYEIGQYVADEGGVIAHRWLSGTTQNYLVLSVSVIADNKRWATVNVSIPNVTSNWDGKTNTDNLVAAGIPSGIGVDEAASICNNYVDPLSSNTDWYLPSVDELSKVWQNRFDVTIGLLAAGSVLATSGALYGDFWSSTQYVSFLSAGNAFRFDFSTGYPSSLAKTSQRSVLAVRKFSI